MKKKFTFSLKTFAFTLFTFVALFLNSLTARTYAQLSCNNETILWSEDFGVGTVARSNPDVIPTVLTYQPTGTLSAEGVYRVINGTQQKPEWQSSEDHTPNDVNGDMLVINGQAETFYSHQIDRTQGFPAGNYIANLYIMNVDTLGLCGPEALLPDIAFRVEYLSQANSWEPLTGSPYQASPIPQTSPASPTWVQLGSSFILPLTGNFLVKSIRIVLKDGTNGGCGNDFAMDDVKLSLCTESGPMPVEFLGIAAHQKGSGVSIDWSTSQEINSSTFDVEKSADGNSNWNLVQSVKAAGNSSTVKSYSVYDAMPFNGNNFYKVKEIDIDGNSKYSKTVSLNLSLNNTAVSVLANPFHSLLTVNFSSTTNQFVTARLIDFIGRQVAVEKWSIEAGSTKRDFSNVGRLQQGMYILTVTNAKGEVLYNNKVIKE